MRQLLLALFLAPLAGSVRAQDTKLPYERDQTLPAWKSSAFGVLLLGHGGSSEWNQAITDVRNSLSSKYPIEVALGMADPLEMQRAVDRLTGRRARKIVAVPLFVSSHSEVIDQTRYVLGLREDPSPDFVNAPHAHMSRVVIRRVRTKLPVVMTPAIDQHPLVAEILLDRARRMSRDPAKESVVLVGHGPLKDSDNALWIGNMNQLGNVVKAKGGFAAVESATLRDDSPPDVRTKADQTLRDLVRKLSLRGRVLVVPHLIAPGGIERHIRKSLDGVFYEWTGKTLLPDPRIAQWIDAMAARYAGAPDMRQFKDEGRTQPPPQPKRLIPADAATGTRAP